MPPSAVLTKFECGGNCWDSNHFASALFRREGSNFMQALSTPQDPTLFNADEAYSFIVKLVYELVKRNRLGELKPMNYCFDIHLPHIIDKYINPNAVIGHPKPAWATPDAEKRVYRAFQDAAWELCLAGKWRMSVADGRLSGMAGAGGDGYSITAAGFEWFKNGDLEALVLSPNAIARMLDQYSNRFGDTYRRKTQEAVKNFRAGTYMSCCTMCGAAAEAILVALAIAKTKDRDKVLKGYKTTSGRATLIRTVLNGVKEEARIHYQAGLTLINAYRDESAHGDDTEIDRDGDAAKTMLETLLRFAKLSEQNWELLTK